MNDRLEKLLVSEQLTPARFADLIGVQRSSISHIISGRNKPSYDFIAKVLQKFPRLNSDWLILGKGDMYKRMVQGSLFDERTPELQPKPALSDPFAVEKQQEENIGNNSPLAEQKLDDNGQADALKDAVSQLYDKEIDRIVVFYKDRTFRSYRASEE